MNDPTKKAMIVLLNQVKTTVTALEDLILQTACAVAWGEYNDPPIKTAKKTAPSQADLNDEEEKHLEDTLERERLAIMESDAVLKDIWAQGKK